MNRREFIQAAGGGIIWAAAGGPMEDRNAMGSSSKTKVSIVKSDDRSTGIKKAIGLLGVNPVKGRDVLIKPNFNTADPFPASTHNDTLCHLILTLRDMGAGAITIGERSGPPDTDDVLDEKGIPAIAKELDVNIINFDELPHDGWVNIQPPGSHWRKGFKVAKPVLDAQCVVSTCCLKTHGYGGVFTMSLKLSVGITHKGNMTELHTSFLSMRKMIAEINAAYSPALIVMDGIECFTDRGPSEGEQKHAGVIVSGTDRIAVDAVGLAVLKDLGSNKDIMSTPIFKQEQIERAVELGLGISGPEGIELVCDDEQSTAYAGRLRGILDKG
jgi:uncharacterized protein (DUF362 family)